MKTRRQAAVSPAPGRTRASSTGNRGQASPRAETRPKQIASVRKSRRSLGVRKDSVESNNREDIPSPQEFKQNPRKSSRGSLKNVVDKLTLGVVKKNEKTEKEKSEEPPVKDEKDSELSEKENVNVDEKLNEDQVLPEDQIKKEPPIEKNKSVNTGKIDSKANDRASNSSKELVDKICDEQTDADVKREFEDSENDGSLLIKEEAAEKSAESDIEKNSKVAIDKDRPSPVDNVVTNAKANIAAKKEKKASKLNLENIIQRMVQNPSSPVTVQNNNNEQSSKEILDNALASATTLSGKVNTAADRILQKLQSESSNDNEEPKPINNGSIPSESFVVVLPEAPIEDTLVSGTKRKSSDKVLSAKRAKRMDGDTAGDKEESLDSDTDDDSEDEGAKEDSNDEEWHPGMDADYNPGAVKKAKRHSVDRKKTSNKDINENEATPMVSKTMIKPTESEVVLLEDDPSPAPPAKVQPPIMIEAVIGGKDATDMATVMQTVSSQESAVTPPPAASAAQKTEGDPLAGAASLASLLQALQQTNSAVRPQIEALVRKLHEQHRESKETSEQQQQHLQWLHNLEVSPALEGKLAPLSLPLSSEPTPVSSAASTVPSHSTINKTLGTIHVVQPDKVSPDSSGRPGSLPARKRIENVLATGASQELPGLPWTSRGLKSLQLLTERWEAGHKTCPHPACRTALRTNFQLFNHWYTQHMAPGYCKVYLCSICNQRYKEKSSFVKHIKYKHDLDSNDAESLSGILEAKWEASVSEDAMLKVMAQEENLPTLSTKAQKLFGNHLKSTIFPLPTKLAPSSSMNYHRSKATTNPLVAQLISPPRVSTSVESQEFAAQMIGKPAQTDIRMGLDNEPVADGKCYPPKNRPIEGLPWTDRSEEQIRRLSTVWLAKHRKCPHPECYQTRKSTSGVYSKFSDLAKHWFKQHMAPGYCKTLSCPCCPTWIKYMQNFKQHLKQTHKMTDDEVTNMVDKVEKKWDDLYDELDRLTGNINHRSSNLHNVLESARRNSVSPPITSISSHSSSDKKTKPNPIVLNIDGIKDDMLEDLDINKIPKERMAVHGLPWKGMKEETSKNLAAAWEANNSVCPHPKCSTSCPSRKMMFAHWHQSHLLPGCGIAYPCYGRAQVTTITGSSERACGKVFDNKWDLIGHCRRDHGYDDDIIQGMFVKIRAIRTNGTDPDLLAIKGLDDVKTVKESKPKRKICWAEATGMRPIPIAKKPATVTQEDSYGNLPSNLQSDVVPPPMYVLQPDQPASSLPSYIKPDPDAIPTSKTEVTPIDISPITLPPSSSISAGPIPYPDGESVKNFSATAAVLFATNCGNLDQSKQKDLPKILWKAILNSWQCNQRCPHPTCTSAPTFPTHSTMLGHWLRNHMDSRSPARLFPCLHGSKAGEDLCFEVYNKADDLTVHLIRKHGYKGNDIKDLLQLLRGEWESAGPAVQGKVPPAPGQQTVVASSPAALQPAPKRRRIEENADSPIVLD